MTDGQVRFRVWGCRGSIPSPGPLTVRYGGETTCFEVTAPSGAALLVDCGSGMRLLGRRMAAGRAAGRELNVLLSHLHVDHLIGLGLFEPLLLKSTEVTLWTTLSHAAVSAAIQRLFGPPLWPIDILGERWLRISRFPAPVLSIGEFAVTPFPLNHPGGATGFRIEVGGKTIVIVCDHEHGDPEIDAGVRAQAAGADLVVYDAAYSDAEYPRRRGWGHSTWEEGLRLAIATDIQRLLMVHHAPEATDDQLDAAAERLIGLAGGRAFALAQDGMELTL